MGGAITRLQIPWSYPLLLLLLFLLRSPLFSIKERMQQRGKGEEGPFFRDSINFKASNGKEEGEME